MVVLTPVIYINIQAGIKKLIIPIRGQRLILYVFVKGLSFKIINTLGLTEFIVGRKI